MEAGGFAGKFSVFQTSQDKVALWLTGVKARSGPRQQLSFLGAPLLNRQTRRDHFAKPEGEDATRFGVVGVRRRISITDDYRKNGVAHFAHAKKEPDAIIIIRLSVPAL